MIKTLTGRAFKKSNMDAQGTLRRKRDLTGIPDFRNYKEPVTSKELWNECLVYWQS